MSTTAPGDAAAGDTVAIPAALAPLAAFLVELGARQVAQQGGSRSVMPRLGELQQILREAAASARGRTTVMLREQTRRPELTTAQAAVLTGLSAHRVRELARTGRLIGRKVANRDWLLDLDSVRGYRGRKGVT